MIAKTKTSQRLGTTPPELHIWDRLPGTGAPPENFLYAPGVYAF